MIENEDVATNVSTALILGELVGRDGGFSGKEARFVNEGNQHNTLPVGALALQINAEVLRVEVDDG